MATTTRPDAGAHIPAVRPHLDDLELSIGKKTRLHRLLYDHGPGNGTMLILPLDQGMEHGPRDFFDNPASADPEYELELAFNGGFSAIALGVGLAKKYMRRYAGKVPLILKLNGKTEIPSDDEAFSSQSATVSEAVELGADAIGYTLYVGSPAQDVDFTQFMHIREEANRLGMPIVVWAYPRGEAVERKGGRDSLWAVDYAARVACELGADVIKLNLPVINPAKDAIAPKPYNTLNVTQEEAMAMVVRSAGRSFVLLSGGSKADDADLFAKAEAGLNAGVTGFIFGRNVWQRDSAAAREVVGKLNALLRSH
jgi:class I fructose-bisphosphate aldolase